MTMHKDDARDGSVTAPREIDRRTIAKGVAWTVPVVIVATAAPAVAASGVTEALTAVKDSGSSAWYTLRLAITNGRTTNVQVDLLSLSPAPAKGDTKNFPASTSVAPGSGGLTFSLKGQAGATYTLFYKVAGGQKQLQVTLPV